MGACISHSVGSPYRVLRNYVFDDNADFLGRYTASTGQERRHSSGPSTLAPEVQTVSTSPGEFSTRHLFSGRVIPTLYIPGHGHVIPPLPRPAGPQEWSNPRDYWRWPGWFSSYWKYLVYSIERPVHLLKNLTCSSVHKDWWRRFVWNWLFNLLRNWFPFISEETSCDMCRVLG